MNIYRASILFVSLAAVACGGNSKTSYGQESSWTPDLRQIVLESCEEETDQFTEVCPCIVQQMEREYPEPTEVPDPFPDEVSERIGASCVNELLSQEEWPQFVRDGFLDACIEKSDNESGCTCVLENAESEYTAKEFLELDHDDIDVSGCFDDGSNNVVDID